MLYAVKIPPYGGDTLFANQYLAYETLSEGLKKTLGDLVGIYTSTKLEVAKTRDNRLSDSGEKLKVLCASSCSSHAPGDWAQGSFREYRTYD